MKKLLKNYSRLVCRRPKTIAGVGILVAIGIIVIGLLFGGSLSTKTMSISGTPATKAQKVAENHYKGGQGATAQVVIKSNLPLTSDKNKTKLLQMQGKLMKGTHVVSAASPEQQQNLASHGKVGYFTVTYKNKTITQHQTNQLKRIASQYRSSDFQVEISGGKSSVKVSELPEIIGIIGAFIILIITFASLLIAGIPIISSLIGLVTGLLGVLFVAKYVDVPSYDISLAAMIALAVGIDYALFFVARYRDELGKNSHELAMHSTIINTVPSILFAASTIIVALLSMSSLGIGFLGVMGNMAALTVFIAVILMLVIVPSVLYLCNIKPHTPSKFVQRNKPVNWFVHVVSHHYIITSLAALVVLFSLALPALHMQLGLPNDGSKQPNTTERKAYDIKAKAYGAGNDATLITLVRNSTKHSSITKYNSNLTSLKHVKSVAPAVPSVDGKYTMVIVTPKTEANSHTTAMLVKKIRNIKVNGHHVMVTGTAAANIDISTKLSQALPKFLLIIVIFAFILLMVTLRSLLIPLVAVLGFVASLLATLGFVTLTIQDGYFASLLHLPGKSAVLNFLPVLVVGILFGLAMDYEVFLVRRIYEEYGRFGTSTKEAVIRGMRGTGSSVISAALIMTTVFVSFAFTDEIIIQSMGIALAVGVFFDAFIVRMLFVPSMIIVFGKANWYFPRWLDKILPKIG